ncbi:hypothetical protein Glove_228g47 [Diversispora epigaea]|uniref:Uncharacterized protein n=1 Tax=Diversispora epigaea TaxID=1348612 RepID=A0A397IDC7_9GLOM|nr:hypothetical protein Glove_228g47 [Diversispora epigaea]
MDMDTFTEHIADSEYYTLHLARLRNYVIDKRDCEDCNIDDNPFKRPTALELTEMIRFN